VYPCYIGRVNLIQICLDCSDIYHSNIELFFELVRDGCGIEIGIGTKTHTGTGNVPVSGTGTTGICYIHADKLFFSNDSERKM
jgi:hypothetical protein